MKRFASYFLIPMMLIALCGCKQREMNNWSSAIRFYYPRTNIEFEGEDGVIGFEERQIVTDADNLNYLLTLYLNGPSSSNLYSPFPENLKIEDINFVKTRLVIAFNTAFEQLNPFEQSLASVSLARTCFEYLNVDSVVIQIQITPVIIKFKTEISRDELLLSDNTQIQ